MAALGYRPTQADPDVWIKRASKQDGTQYYKLMLVYADDVLHIAKKPEGDMLRLGKEYRLEDSIGPQDRYLGSNTERVQTRDGAVVWSLNCYDYLNNAVQQIRDELKEKNMSLSHFETGLCPYPSSYRPEVDATPIVIEEMTNRFQQLIGILRWSIELGRIDILTEVSCL